MLLFAAITVAIIDTGADLSHPELKKNIWVNTKEIPGNGIDDDNNGYIDDVNGWNFVSNNNQTRDRHGHGTHIAGIIKTYAPDAKLMILKYMDPEFGQVDGLRTTVEAIKYAVKMKVDIINYSAGGVTPNPAEIAALKLAEQAGILVVAAAGNESSNSDHFGFYPADYDLPNILSVTAIDSRRRLLATSNFGVNSVDIAAPGLEIRSTLPGGGFGPMTGTSQATAFATAAAARLMASNPQFKDPRKLIGHLLATAEKEMGLVKKIKAEAILNSSRSLSMKSRNMNAFGRFVEIPKEFNEDQLLSDPDVLHSKRNVVSTMRK